MVMIYIGSTSISDISYQNNSAILLLYSDKYDIILHTGSPVYHLHQD